ncbi:MAG: creatininase family protein [Geminicoccaceae bacterium]
MTTLPRHHWHEMRSADFAAVDPERWVAVLPVGAVEQHGPHLPVSVDAAINQRIIDLTLRRKPADLPVTVLPMTWVGRSEEHIDFPGTLTLSAETLTRLWFEIGQSVARAGLRKLVILNSHGGQVQVMQIVARQLRVTHDMFVCSVSWPQLGFPEATVSAEEARHGIHAGDVETSMMLAIRPDLVAMEEAANFEPLSKQYETAFPTIMSLGATGFGWKAQDLEPSGACGNASAATGERGEKILNHVADRLLGLLDEVVRFPLARLAVSAPGSVGDR